MGSVAMALGPGRSVSAEYARQNHYAEVLHDEDLSPERLVAVVDSIVADIDARRARLAEFRVPNSVDVIVTELERAAGLR